MIDEIEQPDPDCDHCEGTGEVDSGAQGMDGEWINLPCPQCTPKASKRFWDMVEKVQAKK